MKKALLASLSVLMLVFAKAQFTVDPGVWKIITIENRTYRIFVPDDYTTGSNYYFHVAFWGDGEQTGAALSSQVPGKWFGSPWNWDGKVHMNNGNVAKFIILGMPNYGIQPQVYANAIDSAFKVLGNKVDTTNRNYFSTSGFSGGPGIMWSTLIESSSPYLSLFRNSISMSPTDLGVNVDVTGRSTTGRHWVWYSFKDNNWGTPEYAAIGLYNRISSSQKQLTNQFMKDPCHCNTIWDSCMSIAGVGVPNGGNAQSNRWRWLVDPNDGVPPPLPGGQTFAIAQLRQKLYKGKSFLYYIPETAQRPNLKHYFIYNIVDSAGKDSAYAVQRGLAKKYKDGWDGKLPLCNGDTAVFTMFTQLNDPAVRAVVELGVQLALDSLPNHLFDTASSRRMRNVLTGIGAGANTHLSYLMDKFVSTQGPSFFRNNFGAFISLDQSQNGNINSNGWAAIKTPLKSWWFTSTTSGWPYYPSNSRVAKDSADNRNPGALTKITEIAASYSPLTWDSAYSTAGNSASNNVFRWIVDTSDCIVVPPPAHGPFIVGQLRQKTHAGKNFLYYISDTSQRATLKQYFIINVIDSSGKDSAYAVQRGLAKKYLNGWNGKQPLCNGDTAVFSMITTLNNPASKAEMEAAIQLALDSLPDHVFDTAGSRRTRNILTGIGLGANTQLTYLMNKFVGGQGTSFFRDNFGAYVSVDQSLNGNMHSNGWATIKTPLKSWWFTSNTSGYPYYASNSRISKDSADNRNPGALTKITEIAANYSPITWDSAYSTTGNTSANNIFIWITDTSTCVVVPPAGPEGPFVVGQLRQKTYGGRNFLYYIPDTAQRATLKHYFIFNVIDSTGKDSAYAVQRGLAKKYKNGWNGKQPLCNGDTAVFSMIMQLYAPTAKIEMERGFQLALDSLPNHIFDTAYSQRMRNILTGIGLAPNMQLTYLMNRFVGGQGTAAFRKSFGVFVSLDQSDNGHLNSPGWAAIERPLKSWWFTSNTSGYPYMPYMSRIGKDSADNHNPGALTKITEIAASYSPVTWDSAYSTAGFLSTNNVFVWITDTTDCSGLTRVAATEETVMLIPEIKSFGITPNPANQVLNIGFTAGEQSMTSIRILHIDGRQVYQKSMVSAKGYNRIEVNVQALVKGQYIVQLINSGRPITKKFLKL